MCVFVCPQGKVVGNIECMVGYSPGKSRVEYPRLPPPGHQTLGRPCSDIWWWSLKPYGFQESASYWNAFLFFCALVFFVITGFFPGGYLWSHVPSGEDPGGRVSMGVGVSGWERGLWYLEVGYTPSLPGYFRVGTHPAPTFSRK